jgi:hypothetical protein
MTFFYDLNKKLDDIRATPELTHGQLNEGAYQGGPDKSQIPAAQRKSKDSIPFYKDSSNNPAVVAQGSNWKMTTKDLEKERTQSPTSAEGMRALQDRLSKINPIDEADMEEGNRFIKTVVDAKADGIQPGEKINVGGKEYPVKEAAKWRNPKFKDKLYTQEPRDYDQYDYGDDDYYNPKPADYPGEKNLKGGSEFDHNDPLQKGQGIGRSGIKNNILDRGPRKGLPSRDQITSLKGSIKSARGTHAEPNLPEAGAPMTAKQKSFAALAEPKDKITFADKIAGAKQEVDEMLGDVAAEAMKTALRGRQNNTEKVDEVEGKVYRHKGTYGQSYDPSDDEETKAKVKNRKAAAGPAKRGRPEQNTKFDFSAFKKPVVAKGTGTGRVHKLSDKEPGQKVKEGSADGQAQQIYNELADLRAAAKQAQRGGQFPQGFASRLETVLYAAMTLIKNQQPGNAQVSEDDLEEKASSKKQQKFMGMVHAAQQGKKPASKEVAKVAKSMGKKDAEDFAATQHKGLPEKKVGEGSHYGNENLADKRASRSGERTVVDQDGKGGTKTTTTKIPAKKQPEDKKKEESVEENTVAGSVAPAEGGAAKGKGGMTFGKGVYEGAIAESFRSKLDTVLNEGMSVNMSADQDGKKSLTVTATDDDAVKLSQLLNLAGIGGQSDSYGAVCPGCGSADCGCDHIDEELANSADNTVYNGDPFQYSDGLNGPKTDQSTLGTVINQDPRRTIGSVAEGVESRLWELYQRYERK